MFRLLVTVGLLDLMVFNRGVCVSGAVLCLVQCVAAPLASTY